MMDAREMEEESMESLLQQLLSGNMPALEELDKWSGEVDPYNRMVYSLCKQAVEAYYFIEQLANGNIGCRAPRRNVLLGSAKELQSILRGILWTCERISEGDYTQTVDFMGDFSTAFNFFTRQVAKREACQKEIIRLEREKLEQEKRFLSEKLEEQTLHYKSLKDMQDQVRGIGHDIKNHCIAINTLINYGDMEGVRDYLASINQEMYAYEKAIYNTGNPIFDALLTDKSIKARKKGIEVVTGFAMKEKIQISNADWCILLGNTLDNAIEACERLTDVPKRITFEARYHKNMLNITIKNTALPPKTREDGLLHTSKEDSANHGLGLKNVLRTVEKYDGVLQTKYQDGWFTLSMMLCDL